MKLYKRPNSPYWWMNVSRLDTNGRVIGYDRKSTKRTDKGEAKLVAQAYAKQMHDRDQLGVRETASIAEVAQRYIQELEGAGKPSVKDYRIFAARLESSISRLPIAKMDRSFLAKIRSDGLKAGYSARYINNMITFWLSVYTKAKRDYGVDTSDIDTRGLKLKTQQKTRYLLPGEEECLLAELDPEREVNGIGAHQRHLMQDQYDLTVFLLDTGARYSEVAEIPWSSVDTVNFRSINLYRSKVGNEGSLHLSDRLIEILSRRYDNSSSNYIFPSRTDPNKPRGYATKGIRAAIERAGLNAPHLVKRYGKFTPHSFRHTFASRLVQGGMSLYAVSKLLGHADTQMTQRYAHLSQSTVSQQAVNILNGGQLNVG
jgi:integrase